MSEKEESVRMHLFVEGRVQGVGFRQWVQRRAQQYQLSGWVRNTHDGEVEIVAEGSRSSVERLVADVQRGPQLAFVTGIRPEWQPASGTMRGFEIEMTR